MSSDKDPISDKDYADLHAKYTNMRVDEIKADLDKQSGYFKIVFDKVNNLETKLDINEGENKGEDKNKSNLMAQISIIMSIISTIGMIIFSYLSYHSGQPPH